MTEEQLQSAHDDFRKHLQASEAKGWDHFDDVVFKLSAGGIAVSLTLLGVTQEIAPGSMRWLYGAWAFWGASLLFLIASIWTGQLGLRAQIARWDGGTYYDGPQPPEGRVGALTPRLNVASITLCGFGLIWLLVFALNNVSGGDMAKNRASYRTGGQPAPQAPPSNRTISSAPGQRGQVAPQAPPAASGTQHPGGGTPAPQAPPANPTPPKPR